MQWAILLTTQPVPVLIDMIKDAISACTAHDILRAPTGNTFCRFVPIHNPTVAVTYVNAII
jgi:hypothetical protein